jgi:penicillin-binding protein 1A
MASSWSVWPEGHASGAARGACASSRRDASHPPAEPRPADGRGRADGGHGGARRRARGPGPRRGAEVVETSTETLLDAPPLPDELPVAAQLSTVHDREGARIAELAGEIRREPVALEDIPEVVIDAVLATEDSGFFEHRGVEHEAMLRAAGRNLAAGGIAEGASTITQQYVKMTLLSPEQTIERKLQEVLLAVELERRDSKEEILEGYLNAIYLGEGVYGVNSAADHYFSKSLDELTVAEAAVLAGSIQAPAVTNPVANEEAARSRRDIVIRQMLAQGASTRRPRTRRSPARSS